MTNPTEDLLIESMRARETYMYNRENHLKKAMRLVAARSIKQLPRLSEPELGWAGLSLQSKKARTKWLRLYQRRPVGLLPVPLGGLVVDEKVKAERAVSMR
jgi:hypothetical protein